MSRPGSSVPEHDPSAGDSGERSTGTNHSGNDEYGGGIFDQGHEHPAGDEGQGVFEQGHQHASGERGQGVFEQGHAEPEDDAGEGIFDQGTEE